MISGLEHYHIHGEIHFAGFVTRKSSRSRKSTSSLLSSLLQLAHKRPQPLCPRITARFEQPQRLVCKCQRHLNVTEQLRRLSQTAKAPGLSPLVFEVTGNLQRLSQHIDGSFSCFPWQIGGEN